MNFDNQLFRCSALGYIMVDPKGKSFQEKYDSTREVWKIRNAEYEAIPAEKLLLISNVKKHDSLNKLKEKMDYFYSKRDTIHLSDTCKTYLADLYTFVKYGRLEDIKNKYLEKGLHLEEDAITLYSIVTGIFHKKNYIHKDNEFIEGEMDFDNEDTAIDTKVNWSIFQFNRTKVKPIKPLYNWQVKGYMWLWEKKYGLLVCVLLDTPEHLILKEERMLLRDFIGTKDDWEEAKKELRFNHTYNDIPNKERIKTFDVTFTEEEKQKIIDRVKECRRYLNEMDAGKTIDVEEDIEEAA